ncbi:MAG: hypothetical protein RLZZ519_623 [Bacteroidota bacterium]|jgi:hypothetical protein
MPRIDLFQLAKENETRLFEKFQDLMSQWRVMSKEATLKRFFDHCSAEWRVSMNQDWKGIKYFLENGFTYNRYRFSSKLDANVFIPVDLRSEGETPVNWNYFESKLHPQWAKRRRKFNEFAEYEEDFTYGAYFVQGDGVKSFGKYILLLRREIVEQSKRTTFLRADTLQMYLVPPAEGEDEARILEDELYADIAHAGSVDWLLCLKKAEYLEKVGFSKCIASICNGKQYLEAQIGDSVGFQEIEKVKIKRLTPEELRFEAMLITSPSLKNPKDSDPAWKKNAYFYRKFRSEFPKKGVAVELF